MEIELPNQNCLFHQISPIYISTLQPDTILFNGICTSPNLSQISLRVLVTNSRFYALEIQQDNLTQNKCYATDLDFDLKFQIIYAQKQNPNSKKLGIKLFHSYEKQNDFFTDIHQVNSLATVLSHSLNQRGFHYHFKPIRKLGKGNFACVYQVARVTDGNRFAVKAFSKVNTFSSQNGKEGLINELSVLRQLSHENILSLQSVFESDNSIYVILELLSRKSLYDTIKERKGEFTIQQIKLMMYGLLKGLEQMRKKRIIHRDLKPENIMLKSDKQYNPVIIDFGLSTPCDIQKYLYYRCGTPGFVAPEVIKANQNMKTEPACDIFSVGCIFHILLTGYPIFPGTQYSEVYQKNKHLQFNLQTKRIEEKNRFAMSLLQEMLKQDPESRISPAQALSHPFFMKSKEEFDDFQTLSIKTRHSNQHPQQFYCRQ